MDFFRGCRTNVWLVDDIWDTRFAKYAGNDELAGRENVHDVVVQLRQRSILCACVGRELLVFRTITSDSLGLLQSSGLELVDEGTLKTDSLLRIASGTAVRDALLDAIQGAISFQLAAAGHVLRASPWTWLVPGAAEGGAIGEGGVLLRLRLEPTDSGTFYATTSTEPSASRHVGNQSPSDAVVILAPSGLQAKSLGNVNTDLRLVDGEDWKNIVATSLRTEGVNLGISVDWLAVQAVNGGPQGCFVWPAHLCLTHHRTPCDGIKNDDWKHYFAASDERNGFKHPLTIAEDWSTGATERQAAADGLAGNGNNDATTLPTSTTIDGDTMLVTSPSFVQRVADQQAAMSGIYPTPPDVLLQSQPATQQPSSDNVMAGHNYHDPNSFCQDFLPSSDDAQPRHSTLSSSNPPAVQRSSDDLFGDMGGEMDFGAGEVGDEDFDFFNEDDAMDAAPSVDDDQTHEADHEATEVAEADGTQRTPVDGGVAETPHPQEAQTDHIVSSEYVERAPAQTAPDHIVGTLPTAAEHETLTAQMHEHHEPEKPLSPFGVKERLLPPPIPASALAAHQQLEHRRSSTFEPVTFREDLDIGRRFSTQYGPGSYTAQKSQHSTVVDISLPPGRKKPRVEQSPDTDSDASEQNSESEEDSYESASSVSDDELPPKTPWTTKKRKRADFEELALSGELGRMLGDNHDEKADSTDRNEVELLAVLDRVLPPTKPDSLVLAMTQTGEVVESNLTAKPERLGLVEEVLQLTKLDLVYTAQLVSEQAVSCVPSITKALDLLALDHAGTAAVGVALQTIVDQLIEHLLPGTTRPDISRLALTREPPSRTMSTPASTRPGQPRPPQRSESILGPDIVAVPPPFVRVQRGADTYEMLPPALDFWETLSLAPPNGQKDVRAYCVYPLNEDLQRLLDTFLSDLGIMYENCKLGSHAHIRNVYESNELDDYEDGLAPVELGEDESIKAALRAYAETCTTLGTFLATVGRHEADRTIVVYMLNPFPHARATQHLCACFWLLCKAYRERTPKTMRNQPRSDVVLQLLPIELLASADGLVVLDAKQYGALAKEVYDRCQPALDSDHDIASALPNFAAPLIELASPPPKRIGFQVTAEPPSDLLHEESALHVAYALSDDGKWLTAVWVDSTGRYHSSTSLCLCGRTFADVATDVWDRTRELLTAREMAWRIFIVAGGAVEESIRDCWRQVIERPRKQPFSVTLLSAQLELDLKLSPPLAALDDSATAGSAPGAGFLTPGTTPQGTSMTVSPDTGGNVAPPTPAPSDSATAIAESDPDAHLINTADESWAVLFSSSTYSAVSSQSRHGLAYGALFKRGEAASDGGKPGALLPSLGASLLWTVQVRPNGNVDDGNAKQAEMTLREVLRMYRNLSVLTKARGLVGAGGVAQAQCMPVHLAAAVRGAESLDRFV